MANVQSGSADRLAGKLREAQQSFESALNILLIQQAAGKLAHVAFNSLERLRRLAGQP